MNKYDWIEVGLRLYGAYLMVQGALAIVGVLGMLSMVESPLATSSFAQALATSFLGSLLLLMAPTVTGWLGNRDLKAKRSDPEPSPEGVVPER